MELTNYEKDILSVYMEDCHIYTIITEEDLKLWVKGDDLCGKE